MIWNSLNWLYRRFATGEGEKIYITGVSVIHENGALSVSQVNEGVAVAIKDQRPVAVVDQQILATNFFG
jgi:hypothetical protein